MSNQQAGANRTYGEKVEEAIEVAYPVYLDRSSHYDARAEDTGVPVQIKGCFEWVSNGTARTRGRWRFWEDDHEYLLENAGIYIVAVYDPDRENPLMHAESIPATDSRLDDRFEWREINHANKRGRACRVRWADLLNPAEVSG